MILHTLFDLLAIFVAGLANILFHQQFHLIQPASLSAKHRYSYLLVLIIGMVAGSVFFGTLNLYLAGISGFSKSMLGGIAGAVCFAEVFKKLSGIKGSTGFYFIPGLCALIIVGRIGCFLAGLPDFTYGTATDLPWGVDFGDQIKRHPVQLYESLSMLTFLIILLLSYNNHQRLWIKQGFYLFVLWYAGQRFLWEFLKPYPTLLGQLNLFHLLATLMIIYALIMLAKSTKKDHQHA